MHASNSFNLCILGTNLNLSTSTANGGCQSGGGLILHIPAASPASLILQMYLKSCKLYLTFCTKENLCNNQKIFFWQYLQIAHETFMKEQTENFQLSFTFNSNFRNFKHKSFI